MKGAARLSGISDFALNSTKLAPDETNLGVFKISLVHFGAGRKNVLKLILKTPEI